MGRRMMIGLSAAGDAPLECMSSTTTSRGHAWDWVLGRLVSGNTHHCTASRSHRYGQERQTPCELKLTQMVVQGSLLVSSTMCSAQTVEFTLVMGPWVLYGVSILILFLWEQQLTAQQGIHAFSWMCGRLSDKLVD